jgi:hypothetical protein
MIIIFESDVLDNEIGKELEEKILCIVKEEVKVFFSIINIEYKQLIVVLHPSKFFETLNFRDIMSLI